MLPPRELGEHDRKIGLPPYVAGRTYVRIKLNNRKHGLLYFLGYDVVSLSHEERLQFIEGEQDVLQENHSGLWR